MISTLFKSNVDNVLHSKNALASNSTVESGSLKLFIEDPSKAP